MKKEMFAVIIITKDGAMPYELANFGEMASDTARRVYFQEYKKDCRSVVALEKITTIEIAKIPQEFKTSWPPGAKTIPVYYFKVD